MALLKHFRASIGKLDGLYVLSQAKGDANENFVVFTSMDGTAVRVVASNISNAWSTVWTPQTLLAHRNELGLELDAGPLVTMIRDALSSTSLVSLSENKDTGALELSLAYKIASVELQGTFTLDKLEESQCHNEIKKAFFGLVQQRARWVSKEEELKTAHMRIGVLQTELRKAHEAAGAAAGGDAPLDAPAPKPKVKGGSTALNTRKRRRHKRTKATIGD